MNTFEGFDEVYTYTRAQAIADGVLVDVSEAAKEAGYKIPVALTKGAWDRCVAWQFSDSEYNARCEDTRRWDVLWMSTINDTRLLVTKTNLALVYEFQLHARRNPDDNEGEMGMGPLVTLVLTVSPDENGKPVATISLPGED